MQGYRNGLRGSLLEYEVKKYSSHRKIPTFHVFRTIGADFEETKKIKEEKSQKQFFLILRLVSVNFVT
jgi:hypothetical protein